MNGNRFSIFDALDNTFVGRLKLREKLTLGNMFITFLVVVLIGVFIYLRYQFSSGQLTTQLEQNIRTRVEQSLLTTGREQSALLGVFFNSMSRNTSVIGSTVEDTFAQRSLLADGIYWDAQESLSRLPSGSWDNPNDEISSIFIPAEVQLTDSLAAKLNTLKYTELVFPSILADNPDIIAIYFGGVTKETVYYPNIDLAAIVPPDFDVTGRPWYVNAAPDNNPERDVVWSTPYQDAALNGLVITASVPVFNERFQFQGVAAMDVQLIQITTLVSNIHIGDTGYAFLVDDGNRLIALPDVGFADFDLTDEAAKLGEVMDPAVLPAAAPQFFEILEKIAAGNEGVFSVTLDESERYVAYQQVPEVGYKLVLVVPAEELLTEAELVRQQIASETSRTITVSLLLIAAILVAATAGSLAIGNRFTKPLESLTQAARDITAGNFDAKAEIRSQDEIGTLANTLNTMTSSLRESIQSLEQRVQERTAALRHEQEKSERRARQYEVIAKVAQTITTTQNLQELLPQITQTISEKFGFYHVGIFMMGPDGTVRRFGRGKQRRRAQDVEARSPTESRTAGYRRLRDRDPEKRASPSTLERMRYSSTIPTCRRPAPKWLCRSPSPGTSSARSTCKAPNPTPLPSRMSKC
ncbi:MAG: HAMP domain-containing protein [Chloroflexi bacterium]|nr:HAMP domain-containing protein [Chloroflexota bacterium]